jgi:hypothetical protein
MDFDDQFRRYFGSDDLASISPQVLAAGIERMAVDFGIETDRGRRFALWSLLYMLGTAPDVDIAFENDDDRGAARDFMALIDRAQES